jgi:hypothetical protein
MKILGQVTDLETKDGVAGALVRVVDHESVLAQTETGPDGRYELAVDLQARPGMTGRPAQVKASKEDFEPALADFELLERDYELDLQIHNHSETLEVLVNQVDGAPLQGVEVLYFMGSEIVHRGITGADGLTSWTVPGHRLDQQALLKVNKDGWYKVERLALLRRNQPRVQVTLEPSTTEDLPLTGRVFDEKGNPLPGASVTLEIAGIEPIRLTTDTAGRWEIVLDRDQYGGEGLLHAEHADYHRERAVKLPLMPNAMHVVPMRPLRPASEGRQRWVLVAGIVVVLAVLAVLLL